jgi:thymidylate synthase
MESSLDSWADQNGNGSSLRTPVAQLGSEEIDQITDLITELKNPNSRSDSFVSAWNPQYCRTTKSFDENVANNKAAYLLSCFQFYVADGKLSCQLYQRSADIFFRRTLQYCLICTIDNDDCSSM